MVPAIAQSRRMIAPVNADAAWLQIGQWLRTQNGPTPKRILFVKTWDTLFHPLASCASYPRTFLYPAGGDPTLAKDGFAVVSLSPDDLRNLLAGTRPGLAECAARPR